MSELKVVQSFHDDWLVNIQLSDGRVFTFQTEMWPVHLDRREGYDSETQSNMVAAECEARSRALYLASREATAFLAECNANSIEELKNMINCACAVMSDKQFRNAVHY